ncbi:post-segregation antitoxin CcdA [Rhizobium rhizosphaerae]|uniref:Post-segregation antitoxin CcdA n=1 Tax=Xaviernesmea rhizosphaerae TaxID=1672749 RepID=A0A1Q9ACV6_9HYPH|nr:type II toxin-antitoxin system CcdA family antitoxin [Xaviernesmea rhizosphaerae]OLP52731.1 post-segregation antitoxin CcdA [Xaviernesmea rhizosphaerae]
MTQAIRTADLALDERLLAEAEALKIDVPRAAAEGVAQAVKAEKERLWRIENAEAIAACNDYVAKHGLPLARYRQF